MKKRVFRILTMIICFLLILSLSACRRQEIRDLETSIKLYEQENEKINNALDELNRSYKKLFG